MDKLMNLVEQIKNVDMKTIVDIIIAIIIVILFCMISSGIAYVIVKIFNMKEKKKTKIKKNAFYKPIQFFIIVTGFYVGFMFLKLPTDLKNFIIQAYKISIIFIVAKGVANFFNPDSIVFEHLQSKTNYNGDETLGNFISKIIKTIIYIIAGYLAISQLGFNLGGLAAGLGLSGVVVALAAQDIAKNLFGGFAIIMDKPFIVGDWIQTKTYSGTVEDITFRSTRIRTADHSLVTIQNSTISSEPIVNWSRLDKKRYSFTLNLPIETSAKKVEKIMNKIRFVLENNKKIIEGSMEVHFERIEKDAIIIYIFMNTDQIAYSDYEIFKDEINIDILEVLASENITLSYPGQNVYLKETPDFIENLKEEEKKEQSKKNKK